MANTGSLAPKARPWATEQAVRNERIFLAGDRVLRYPAHAFLQRAEVFSIVVGGIRFDQRRVVHGVPISFADTPAIGREH